MKSKLLLAGICMMLCAVFVPAVNVSAAEQEEKVAHITDEEFQGIEIQTITSPIAVYATQYGLNWTVPKNIMYATDYFSKSKGSSINISVTLTKSCDVGIMSYEGGLRYLTGTSINHTFNITKTDKYKVFIRNNNSSSVTSSGYYTR